VQETRAGVTMVVLHENVQRLQTQIDGHSGAIEQLYTKFDRLEATVDIGFDNLQTMLRELLMQRLPVVEQPTMVQPEPQREAQSGQGGGAPIVGKQPSILEPIEPIPMRVEARNVRPMRAPNHEVHSIPISHGLACLMMIHLNQGQKGSMKVYFSTRL
jgi:hypothetical protein